MKKLPPNPHGDYSNHSDIHRSSSFLYVFLCLYDATVFDLYEERPRHYASQSPSFLAHLFPPKVATPMPCDADLGLIPSPNLIQSSTVAPWHRFAQDHQIPKEWVEWYCWWFRNPANQLRLVVYLIIYKVLYIQTVVVWDFFHQHYAQPMGYKVMSWSANQPFRGETAACFNTPTANSSYSIVQTCNFTSWVVPCGMFDLMIPNMFWKTCWKETAQTLYLCHAMLIIENPPTFLELFFGIVFGQRLKAFWPHVSAKSMVAVISLVLPSMLSPHLTKNNSFPQGWLPLHSTSS